MGDTYLIVNADDFGQSRGVNRGIIEAHERGIVTSTSLMVRWPAVAEVARQLDTFRALIGRNPSHLDSHQHAHRREPARSVAAGIARALGIPLRHYCAGVRYCGRFYGQDDEGHPYPDGISVEGLIGLLEGLPAGSTELGCHPALGNDLETMYLIERAEEVRTLCDPRIRAALAARDIELRSFADVTDRSVTLA
jgi:chitin disaccharide deacetylase